MLTYVDEVGDARYLTPILQRSSRHRNVVHQHNIPRRTRTKYSFILYCMLICCCCSCGDCCCHVCFYLCRVNDDMLIGKARWAGLTSPYTSVTTRFVGNRTAARSYRRSATSQGEPSDVLCLIPSFVPCLIPEIVATPIHPPVKNSCIEVMEGVLNSYLVRFIQPLPTLSIFFRSVHDILLLLYNPMGLMIHVL